MDSSKMVIRVSALLLAGLLPALGEARAGVVYQNDFETNTAGFSSSNRVALPTTANPLGATSQFLGKFGNDAITLSLSGLTAGTAYSVRFDLYTGATWDGSFGANNGPDIFKLTAGSQSLVDATFARANTPVNGVEPLRQSYSDATPNGGAPYAAAYYARTGADVIYANPTNITHDYSIYYFGHGAGNPYLTFTATGTTETLTFSGSNLQALTDEFWAIDDVEVATVPEPASIVTSMIGLVAAAAFARRRLLRRG